MNTKILSDVALEDLNQDLFGYAGFAKNIAEAISAAPADDCLAFALYGPWGSGKTTVLNFVLRHIKHWPLDQQPIILRFNPWWFSGTGDLLGRFFQELRIALGKAGNLKRIAAVLGRFGTVLSHTPWPTGAVGKAVEVAAHRLSRSSQGAWDLRRRIAKGLRKQQKRVLVVIDDIDRLASEDIKALFKVIKAVADFPRTTYLLAFDKAVVVAALSGLQGISGEDYLEKIVQVPYELPMPDRSVLTRMSLGHLETSLSRTPSDLIDETRFANVFLDGVDPLLKTPRDVKRLANAVAVGYPSVCGEVNPTDFVGLQAVKLFCPALYRRIEQNPDMFAGGWPDLGAPSRSSHRDTCKEFHETWLREEPEEKRPILQKLLTRLFPKLEGVFGNTTYPADWDKQWRAKLRICSLAVLPTYFRLGVPDGCISNAEFRATLAYVCHLLS